MNEFLSLFVSAVVDKGEKVAQSISTFGWQEYLPSKKKKELLSKINWEAITDSNIHIGWWEKFCGTFTDNETAQLVIVDLPLTDGTSVKWGYETTLAEMIHMVCSGIQIYDKYNTFRGAGMPKYDQDGHINW